MRERNKVGIYEKNNLKIKIIIEYGWNPFSLKKMKLFIQNNSTKSFLINDLYFKINGKENNFMIIQENFIEDDKIINSNEIQIYSKDLSLYDELKKEKMRSFIEFSHFIPIFINIINFDSYLDQSECIQIHTSKIFEKNNKNEWVEIN